MILHFGTFIVILFYVTSHSTMTDTHTLQKASITSLLRLYIFGMDCNSGGNKGDRHGIPFLNSVIIFTVSLPTVWTVLLAAWFADISDDSLEDFTFSDMLIVFVFKTPSCSSFTLHIPNRTLLPTSPHLLQGDHVAHSVNTRKSWPSTTCGGWLCGPFRAAFGLTCWAEYVVTEPKSYF